MATYPVVHKESGEQKEVVMSVTEWSQWCDDNPDWKRDWSDPSTCPMAAEVGDWGEINYVRQNLDGMMFFKKHKQLLDLE